MNTYKDKNKTKKIKPSQISTNCKKLTNKIILTPIKTPTAISKSISITIVKRIANKKDKKSEALAR